MLQEVNLLFAAYMSIETLLFVILFELDQLVKFVLALISGILN